MRAKKILACDCETDPFLHGRVPVPFIWGLYDGKDFLTFRETADFVRAVYDRQIILYAHNGGKFDFMFLLDFIKETKAQIINGRIVSMFLGRCELRDSFSIIPEPLKNFGDKKEIEHWKLEARNRNQFWDEILEYNFYDCKILWDATTTYRDMVGAKKTIASNALTFAKKLGIDPGRTTKHHDEKYRRFFYGGRTEVFQPGTHHDITVIDIRSAYPEAMTHDHATGIEFVRGKENLTRDEINRSFFELTCFSNGAFPFKARNQAGEPTGGLSFPIGYGAFEVTGWEYLAAMDLGLISDVQIQSVRTPTSVINFKEYVEHWYAMKLANPKTVSKINYTIAKILMNSLYGKLSQDISNYFDYKIVPPGTPCCKCVWNDEKEGLEYNEKCPIPLGSNEHGWIVYLESPQREIHRRESLFKHKFNHGKEWKGELLYNNVATGASITGYTRAKLLRTIHAIGPEHVIYCDTDSLILKSGADLSKVAVSENLGDWQIEEKNCPIGHFAGKKLYAIKTASGKDKIASKGSKLAFADLEKIVNGETVTWDNPAPTFRIDGKALFVHRDIRATGNAGHLFKPRKDG